jgi:microcystin degradation protein MlrC
VSPRAAYEPIASEMILVDTPGVTAADLRQFAYHQRRTPLFPFERDVRYPIGAMP